MITVAYSYSDPLLESPPPRSIWGREVDHIYQDLGQRQQLQRLLDDCRTQSIETVLVRRFDELGESLEAVSDRLAAFETLGVRLIAVDDEIQIDGQSLNLTRSEMLRFLQEIQRRQRQRRIRLGHAQNRVKALPPPGKAPYGYRRGKDRYALDRAAAPIVKDFFEHFLLYGSLRGSVRYLAKKYNKRISVSTGRRWLTSPVYRGDLIYQTGETISNTHVAVLSRDEAAQIDRLLRRNQALSPRAASAPRSLAGLVTCDRCGSAMKVSRVTARRKTQEYLYLRPVACPFGATRSSASSTAGGAACRAIPYQQILDQTIQRICEDLPRAVAGSEMPDIEGIKQSLTKQIEAKQSILEQIPTLVESGVLDEKTAALRAYTVRTEIAAIQSRRDQLPPVNLKAIAQTVSIPQFWFDLSEAERRFYFREFIRQILVIRDEQRRHWHLTLRFIF
ncbi:MAG TPA: recombinase family protein [Elainellaceae cyanobacterium]